MRHTVQCDVGGKTLTIESGWIAGQADGSVTLRLGDTVMLITACMSDKAREGIDFFPLSVDYEERMYSVGRIPGSFFRREGRPSTEGILAGRLTDRPIRPLFPKGFRNEVQVVATILSADQENPPDVLSIVGASAALSISSIPFDGPIAGCRIGYVDGQMVVNPTFEQMESSTMELIVAGSKDAVVMVEAGAKEISESIILDAIEAAQEANGKIVDAIEELVKLAGKPKITIEPPPTPREAAVAAMNDDVRSRVREAVFAGYEKGERDKAVGVIQSEVAATLPEDVPSGEVRDAFDSLVDEVFRKGVLKENVRADGRQRNEVRPITTEVGVLPRTHGTGLFTRGQTQVLSVVTLGSLSDEQRLDTLSPVSTKRYMHHYNFPPYSVGEVKRVGTPGRREIGHGALAERALEPMIPDKDDFPYTIRIVSEALSSNGSTSMGSVCGSTLSLMDAGVPIKAPVAGVAMGLIMDAEGDYAVLTDIQGIEDHLGDMDFKVAGTAEGITALQMDIKIKGITPAIMREAMAQAKEARLFILDKILSTISTHRENMSPFAPRMIKINIPVDKIGAIIGPGGKTIRAIIAETKATIDVQDDGTVFIGSPNEDSRASARSKIEGLTKEAEVGTIFKGKVVRSTTFGAFVEILPGKDGLVRLSELAEEPVQRVEDAVNVGDEVSVMVIEVDRLGRINLSTRAVIQGLTPEAALASAPQNNDGDRGGRPNFTDRRPNFQRGPGGPPRRN